MKEITFLIRIFDIIYIFSFSFPLSNFFFINSCVAKLKIRNNSVLYLILTINLMRIRSRKKKTNKTNKQTRINDYNV